MSYQVLARKWRPNRFGELVGQEHVVTAISNALDSDRLHHAYLFTGTRGVGKTTIARIFSKSLNCEQGLGSEPCGKCSTCKEIENGNFIDLLEIDAASRTKVEDTRELLDNVQYKPSRGRYKVYLIDEVHMLSKHSFNALLKTLEEPPPHVKFLLATTDPQKLPVTILSRCLQFNLKALSRGQISQQLEHVLAEESIPCDKEALSQLARAAQGSMRDALSLTDQAIAQGNGVVGLQIVTDMLGLMDKNQVLKLVHSIVQKDSTKVMQQVQLMSEQAPDFALVLAEMMSLLHQVALTQFVPDACKLETISARAIFQLAKSVPSEQIQLLYQIALTGKKDLPHAVDARTGLEMTLLRMLAFCPSGLKLDALDISTQAPEVETVLLQPQYQNDQAASVSTTTVASESAADIVAQPEKQTDVTPEVIDELSVPADESLVHAHETQTGVVSETPEQVQTEQAQSQPQPQPYEETQSEQDLFAQQQDIMAQAQGFGHQPIDYDEYEPVSLNEQPTEPFTADNSAGLEFNSEPPNPITALVDEQQIEAAPSTSTADLIALRNKLKQSQRLEGEGAEQVKKSESSAQFDLASVRKQNEQQEKPKSENKAVENVVTSPTQAPPMLPFEAQPNAINAQVEQKSVPPWPVDSEPQHEPITSPFSAEKNIEEAEFFDPNAHLDEENVGDVTIDIPAFLANKEKVQKALQVDDWSKLIEDMQVTALTKQLALHSAFAQTGEHIKLTLLEAKAHLNSETAQAQLKNALSTALNIHVELEIELGKPINTPYALQIKVNQVRKEYAHQVIENDPGIQLLEQQFSAKVDMQSIQAR